ncbi:putative ATP synthase, F0 complex, subunit C, F/V-ATP synthase subunit C superfamily [Helianthus anomalus]
MLFQYNLSQLFAILLGYSCIPVNFKGNLMSHHPEVGQGIVTGQAIEGIAKQPEAEEKILVTFFLV